MNSDSVTYICFVQDHSGSMAVNKINAVNNFNEQRAKILKEDDKSMDNLVTIVEFDNEVHCNTDNIPIGDIKEMKEWWCGATTALYDAIAFSINKIKAKMKADGRDDKAVLMVIQTDGDENQSSDYPREKGRLAINKMINELEDTKLWSFVFLGENIDTEVAMGMGFKAANFMSHKSGDENVKAAYAETTDGLDTFMKMRKTGKTQIMNFYSDGDGNDNDQE
jgi:uncharacterized protein YegL